MKKLILSSVALLGLFGAFVAPAQAQVIVNSTPTGGSATGASSFTNFNGSTSAIAGEVTFPGNTYATGVLVAPTSTGGVLTGDVRLDSLTVTGQTIVVNPPATGTSVEAAVATAITTGPALNDRVSLIRAWTSGGLN